MMGRAVEVSITTIDPSALAATFTVDGERIEIWFQASVPLFTGGSDAMVPLGLLAAMSAGCPLVVPGHVSPRLLANAGRAQDIMAAFENGLRPTTVVAEPGLTAGAPDRGVGAFFSCGVDSFFTALKHQDEISHLIFVRGFDVFDIESGRGVAARDSARRAAAGMGKELIEIDSNFRDLTQRFVSWNLAHGPVLGAIALLLQSNLRRVYVPASDHYRDLYDRGSHPLLDPLWGTESLEIVHDGCEATRPQKVGRIAGSDVALPNLRVCNRQQAVYNCGRCEKCLRTMIALRLIGALERCPTLPDVELRRVARIPVTPSTRAYVRENLELAWARRDWKMVSLHLLLLRRRPLKAVRHQLGNLRRWLRRRPPRRTRAGNGDPLIASKR